MKKVICLILMISILIINLNTQSFAGEYRDKFYIEYDGQVYRYNSRIVTVEIDGHIVETGDMPAIILDGRTLVPAREVFESKAINAEVEWNGDAKEVYISFEDKFIVLKIDSSVAYVNNQSVDLDVPAKLIRDLEKEYSKTMIPLRFVTENLGFDVEWDADTYTAKITRENEKEDIDAKEQDNDNDIDIDEENEENEENVKNEEDISEQLDEISSEEAARPLPTELKDNPIKWLANYEDSNDETYSVEITKKDYPDVEVSEIEYVESGGINKFIIHANGPISSLDHFMWDGKYIVDIHGAMYDLDDEEGIYKLTYEDNAIVTSVRSSQQEPDSEGRDVLRVVFDLRNPNNKFRLSLNEDRSQIILEMDAEKLSGVELGQNSEGDYIKLTGSSAFQIQTTRLSNPNRLVFDIINTITVLGYQEADDTKGQYVTGIRTAQFDDNTTRVVIDTDGQPSYEISYIDEDTTLIQLKEPTYSNIKYENYDNPTITLEKTGQIIDLNQIKYEDYYMEREYVITLPGNYQEVFGKGGLQVNDGHIDYVNITEDSNGNTKLIIKSKEVYEYRIESDGEEIFIRAYKPKEIYSKIIVVDAGHGGKDPGAVANGVYEKDINLAITKYLKELFDTNNDIKVYYTRLDDTYISLQQRTDLANEVEADFFLSIHNNSYYSKFHGTETIYFKDKDIPGLNSNELAQIFQDYMIKEVGLYNRGIKANNTLFVLRNTKMPAALVEGGFLTNSGDVAKLKDPNIQKKFAKALYEATLEVFRQYPTGR